MIFPSLLRTLCLISALSLSVSSIPIGSENGDDKPIKLNRSERFDNHVLVRVDRNPLLEDFISKYNVDVWKRSLYGYDLHLSPQQLTTLKSLRDVKITIMDYNIQRGIDKETEGLNRQLAKEVSFAPEDWFKAYHMNNDISAWMADLAKNNPDLVTLTSSIGKSAEGRNIPMLRITSKKGGNAGTKKHIWFQGLQHAREWISTATVQYIAYLLVSQYGSNSRVTNLLDNIEFLLVPVVNPDGYEYTWKTNRLWRKTRAVINGRPYGVDPNRNWPDHWNNGGSSSDPNSDVYMGPSPGSEPEVKTIMNEYAKYSNMIGAIDFHSYSQLVLRPYGWTNDVSPDEAAFSALGDKLVNVIRGVAGTEYTSETDADLYIASGAANDWFYGMGSKAGSPKTYGLTIELSPADGWGGEGFILPPEKILPVGKEIFAAAIEFSEHCLNNPLPKKIQE